MLTVADIDRQNLAAAKLQGVMEDLNMSEEMFATAIAVLFASYIPFQVPSNMFISRIKRPGLCECLAHQCRMNRGLTG